MVGCSLAQGYVELAGYTHLSSIMDVATYLADSNEREREISVRTLNKAEI